jgi:predicted phosphodiesterase
LEIGSKKIELSEGEPLNIYFIGDIHEGEINCQHDSLNDAVKRIAKSSRGNQTKTVLMGDLINCIVHSDKKRFNPAEFDRFYKVHDLIDLPQKQAERVNKFLEPIKDTVDIILVGNHEEEYIKRHNFNIYKNIYEKYPLATPLGYVGLFRYNVKIKGDSTSMVLDLALNHGDGGSGGDLPGNAINRVFRTFTWFDADISVMGHIHRLAAEPIDVVALNNTGTGLRHSRKWEGCSGCFLKTYEPGNRNYFEAKGKKPSDIGMLRAEIVFRRKLIDGKRQWYKEINLERCFL